MFTGKDWGYVSQTKKESNGTKAACKSACHGNVDGKPCMDRVIDRGVVTHCARKRTGKADFAVRISSCGVCGGKCRSGLFAFCRARCFGIGTCRGRYFALCCVGVIACACLWYRRQCFAGTQGAFMCGISAICHDRSQACLRERCREAAPLKRAGFVRALQGSRRLAKNEAACGEKCCGSNMTPPKGGNVFCSPFCTLQKGGKNAVCGGGRI